MPRRWLTSRVEDGSSHRASSQCLSSTAQRIVASNQNWHDPNLTLSSFPGDCHAECRANTSSRSQYSKIRCIPHTGRLLSNQSCSRQLLQIGWNRRNEHLFPFVLHPLQHVCTRNVAGLYIPMCAWNARAPSRARVQGPLQSDRQACICLGNTRWCDLGFGNLSASGRSKLWGRKRLAVLGLYAAPPTCDEERRCASRPRALSANCRARLRGTPRSRIRAGHGRPTSPSCDGAPAGDDITSAAARRVWFLLWPTDGPERGSFGEGRQ